MHLFHKFFCWPNNKRLKPSQSWQARLTIDGALTNVNISMRALRVRVACGDKCDVHVLSIYGKCKRSAYVF